MSASICWRPVTSAKNGLSINSPSSFIRSLEKAFGVFPVKLDIKDVAVLKGMASVDSFDSEESQYEKIIEIINKVGEIEIFAEY